MSYEFGSLRFTPLGTEAFVGLGARLFQRRTVWTGFTPDALRVSSACDWTAGFEFCRRRSSWSIDCCDLLAWACAAGPSAATATAATASNERTNGNREGRFICEAAS